MDEEVACLVEHAKKLEKTAKQLTKHTMYLRHLSLSCAHLVVKELHEISTHVASMLAETERLNKKREDAPSLDIEIHPTRATREISVIMSFYSDRTLAQVATEVVQKWKDTFDENRGYLLRISVPTKNHLANIPPDLVSFVKRIAWLTDHCVSGRVGDGPCGGLANPAASVAFAGLSQQ